MTFLVVLSLAAVLTTLTANLVFGWKIEDAAACPGTTEFCNGAWWTAVTGYLPAWLLVGQFLVTGALASTRAIIRI